MGIFDWLFGKKETPSEPKKEVKEPKKQIHLQNKEALEELIIHVDNKLKKKSSKAYKVAKSFRDRIDSGEIENEDKLYEMIEKHCNSFSDAEVIKILPQFGLICGVVSPILTEWNKKFDMRELLLALY